jgi:hypothetical protein
MKVAIIETTPGHKTLQPKDHLAYSVSQELSLFTVSLYGNIEMVAPDGTPYGLYTNKHTPWFCRFDIKQRF